MDNTRHFSGIYAIYDRVADSIIGGLQTHKHDAAAVRAFTDVARDSQTMIHRHPADYDLVKLGYVTHQCTLDPEYSLLLNGSTLAALDSQADESSVQA